MCGIQVKAFILQKDGSLASCQDRIAINTLRGRFVVADGVTNSYRPEIVAQTLCQQFVNADIPVEEWDAGFESVLKDEIIDNYTKSIDAIEARLTGRRLQHAVVKRNNLPAGASTMAAVEFDRKKNQLNYVILGDSTLFVIDLNNKMSSYCSNIDVSEDGSVQYSDQTMCVSANGTVVGQWLIGRKDIAKGYIALMTDGCAKWFQQAFIEDANVIERLWNLQDEEFALFAADCRSKGVMDDDLSVILMKIDGKLDDGIELLSCPQTALVTVVPDSAINDFVNEPSAEEPSAEEPSAEEPSDEEPSVEEPSVEEPSDEESSVEECGYSPWAIFVQRLKCVIRKYLSVS